MLRQLDVINHHRYSCDGQLSTDCWTDGASLRNVFSAVPIWCHHDVLNDVNYIDKVLFLPVHLL